MRLVPAAPHRQVTPRHRWLWMLTACLLAACGGDAAAPPAPPTPNPPPAPPTRTPSALAVGQGDQQVAAGGASVAVVPTVMVRDGSGQPLANVPVRFTVIDGGGAIADTAPITDALGIASVQRWTLGLNGRQRLRASVGALPPVTFEATLTRGTEQYDATIGAGGGTFGITQDGYAFNGLTLTVPAGAVADGTVWRFRERADPLTLTLPTGYRAVGPVLEISTNQTRANHLLALDVPLPPAPSGTALLLALRDPTTGVLDLLPMVRRTATSARVLTQHLRGDLLTGATPASVSSSTASTFTPSPQVTFPAGGAQLVILAIGLPLPVATGERNVWPVVEHGTAMHPDGHGPATALLEMIASATAGFPRLAELVRVLDQPGAYAEDAPLAALALTADAIGPALTTALTAMKAALSPLPKASRDSLMHQQTTAAIALTGRMLAAAHSRADLNRFLYTTVVAGGPAGLTLVPSSQRPSVELLLRDATFRRVAMRLTATSDVEEVDEVLPISSFMFDVSVLRRMLERLRPLQGLAIGSPARLALIRALRRDAGLPAMRVLLESIAGGGELVFDDDSEDDIVIRHDSARIRITGLGVTGEFSLHDLAGQRADSGVLDGSRPIASFASFGSLAPFIPQPRTIAAYAKDGPERRLLQTRAAFRRFLFAPFTLSPKRDTIRPGATRVTFEAAVRFPPQAGFRIHWDWGDGTSTENLGLTSATHEYAVPGNYTVVARLRTPGAPISIGIDTAFIVTPPARWRGWVRGQIDYGDIIGRFEANDIRWDVHPTDTAPTGWTRFHVVDGEVSYWNEVPCHSYTSPVQRIRLDSGPFSSNRLTISDVVPATPPGTGTVRRYYGQAFKALGPRTLARSCPTTDSPVRPTYEFAGPPIFFQSNNSPLATNSRTTSNPDLLEDTFTLVSPGVRTTWTWRFEREVPR